MQRIIVSPPEQTSWSMWPDELRRLVSERWPEGEVLELEDSGHALGFGIARDGEQLAGRFARDGRSVAIEQATAYELAAEFAVWFRSHVPLDQPLLVWDEAFNWSAELSPATSSEDVLAAVE
jgi:hypothetical protein